MWIMTRHGILMPSLIPPAERRRLHDEIFSGDETINPNWDLQIRTRDRAPLVALAKIMGGDLGPIIATPQMDYEYRAYCTKRDFADAMQWMIKDINYEKFKPAARTKFLHDLYVRIWEVVYFAYDKKVKRKR